LLLAAWVFAANHLFEYIFLHKEVALLVYKLSGLFQALDGNQEVSVIHARGKVLKQIAPDLLAQSAPVERGLADCNRDELKVGLVFASDQISLLLLAL
jgi:hypothetical protein